MPPPDAARPATTHTPGRESAARALRAAFVLGIGLGGFVDGIVLHQILQWHNMLSNRIPPDTMAAMRTNMTADGLFHAAVWLVTLVGILMLYRAGATRDGMPALRRFAGALLLGWAAFNLVEGVIDHHLLALHDVRETPDRLWWNLGFLAIGGVVLGLLGWFLARRDPMTERLPRPLPD